MRIIKSLGFEETTTTTTSTKTRKSIVKVTNWLMLTVKVCELMMPTTM